MKYRYPEAVLNNMSLMNPSDFNGDGRVNYVDQQIFKSNQIRIQTQLFAVGLYPALTVTILFCK